MDKISVVKLNEAYLKVLCEPSIAQELNDFFTFDVPGAKFMPSYRNKMWDGKIRLYNLLTQTLYSGLIRYVEEFCKSRNYEIEYEYDNASEEFSIHEAKNFISTLNIPNKFENRDYQLEAFVHAVRERRSLLLSPTASGKSFIIYTLMRYYNAKTLIIVPTTTLVHQLASDFREYGYNEGRNYGAEDASGNEWSRGIHKIYAGQEKRSPAQVTISTWQSIYKESKEWFDQFEVVIGDEAHLFKSKSLISIMTKLENCKYRFGFTGTLDGTQTHKLVLEGLFGPVRKVISTAELIDQKHLADFKIKAIVLSYPEEVRKMIARGADYQAEMDYIVRLDARNNFIKNLALSLEGNTLLLFQYVDKHGKALDELIKKESKGKNVYFVHGGVEGAEREQIRKLVNDSVGNIIIASYGTFSTGINIPNIDSVIFASPSKSRIRNLQSIGRGLRKSDRKSEATLFDIADNFTWKQKKNFTLLHFMERIKIYNEEKFEYKIYDVNLKV
jgi:superfamily II DNA or RNA helicase